MTHKFSLEEQTTTFTIDATDRTLVRVYSNDPVFKARLEKVGAKVYRQCEDGGMFFNLSIEQLFLRKGKPRRGPLTAAQVTALNWNA